MAETTVARHSHEGDKFEILVKPDPALEYKTGKRRDLSSVLVSDEIYTDAGKGTRASSEKMAKAFGTDDPAAVAEAIMKKGTLNLTTAQRRKMTEEKRRQIISIIAKTYVDPRSHLPHPPLRVEQAMKDARVSVDPQRGAEEQAKEVADSLRSVMPLKSESMELEITVPAQFASQSYSVLKAFGTLRGEQWQPDGSLKAILEIPAAQRPTVIDKLGSATRGTATAEMRR